MASVGSNMLKHRMALCKELWAAGVKAEFLFDLSPKPQKQIDYALEQQIPYVIWIGGDEIREQRVKLKDLSVEQEISIPRDRIIAHMVDLIKKPLPVLPPPPQRAEESNDESAPSKGGKPSGRKGKESKRTDK